MSDLEPEAVLSLVAQLNQAQKRAIAAETRVAHLEHEVALLRLSQDVTKQALDIALREARKLQADSDRLLQQVTRFGETLGLAGPLPLDLGKNTARLARPEDIDNEPTEET